jgi:hypothetical protein
MMTIGGELHDSAMTLLELLRANGGSEFGLHASVTQIGETPASVLLGWDHDRARCTARRILPDRNLHSSG